MTPWLSVIMPIHNGQRFLLATLESAARERPDGVEFLLLDTSDDLSASCSIAERFKSRLDIHFIDVKGIVSWTDKSNLGVAHSRAAHVCMLHQDDLWLPGHLAAVKIAMQAAPECGLSVGPSLFINAEGKTIGHWRLPFAAGKAPDDTFLATLLVQNTIAVPSAVVRRDLWNECGGLESRLWYTADWDLYLKLASVAPVFVREQETTAFRIHKTSLTVSGARDDEAFRRQLQFILDRHLSSVPDHLRKRTEQLARVSLELNCAMASVLQGQVKGIARALERLLRLGPSGISAYLYQSRFIDRIIPRLRALGPL